MAVDADREQDSDITDSSDDEAGTAALDSDDEQGAYDGTTAAADDASDSDGAHRLSLLQLQLHQASHITNAAYHDAHNAANLVVALSNKRELSQHQPLMETLHACLW